MSYRSDASY